VKKINSVLTGQGRSGSRKTTRRICSTATWSFCSSNWFQGAKKQYYFRYRWI